MELKELTALGKALMEHLKGSVQAHFLLEIQPLMQSSIGYLRLKTQKYLRS